MDLITVIIVLVVVGFILWAINRFIPMQAWVKNLLNVAVILILIVWLLKAFGLFGALNVRV